jgi:hypothetical protein
VLVVSRNAIGKTTLTAVFDEMMQSAIVTVDAAM